VLGSLCVRSRNRKADAMLCEYEYDGGAKSSGKQLGSQITPRRIVPTGKIGKLRLAG
jgi:hypothetical protein